jgi:hypothetical protein
MSQAMLNHLKLLNNMTAILIDVRPHGRFQNHPSTSEHATPVAAVY